MRHLLLAGLLGMISTPAFAEFEIRAHYGALQSKAEGFNNQIEGDVKNAPDLSAPTNLGVDATFSPPVLPLVFGLRYETFSFKKSGEGSISNAPVDTTGTLSGNRASLLVGYRLISLPIGYAGLIAHYALSQKMSYQMKSKNGGGATHTDDYKAKLSSGFGIGAEGGARVGRLTIGAEVGYTIIKANEVSDDLGVRLDSRDLQNVKLDLSGTYFKVLVGARF